MRLKKKDFRLLYELDANYRQPSVKLCKKTRMSEQLISHKIAQYHKKSIIRGTIPLIDYARFGLHTYIVFFKASYHSEEKFHNLVHHLTSRDDIIMIFECDGKYDLLAMFISKNPSAFNKSLKHLLSEVKGLKEGLILTTIVHHLFLRNYLVRKEGLDDLVMGGDRDELVVDTLGKKLLAALLDGSKRIVDIARQVGATEKTVRARLLQLQKSEIVKGYRLNLDISKLGVTSNILLIRFGNISKEQDDKFRYFCEQHPNISEFIRSFGEWDALLFVETMGGSEFRKIFLQIREHFEDVIEDFDNFRVFEVHKKQFLPKAALE